MTRMARLSDDFDMDRPVETPSGLSMNGQSLFREQHESIDVFVGLAYDDGWICPGFDWVNWDEGRAIASDTARVAEADMLTVRQLITALVRNERFCEGALQSAYEQGLIGAILRRIQLLHDEQKEQCE